MKRLKDTVGKYKNECLVFVGGILLVGGLLIGQQLGTGEITKKDESNNLIEVRQSSEKNEQDNKVVQEQNIEVAYVDIKGAVTRPGIYQVEKNMRLIDVVEKAGGFAEKADTKKINFAKLVEDQMVIYIPQEGEEIEEEKIVQEEENTVKGDGNDDKKININTADVTELQKLNGIGEKKAEEIIRYREEQGSFNEIGDLTKVKGIGEKTFESLKELITIK